MDQLPKDALKFWKASSQPGDVWWVGAVRLDAFVFEEFDADLAEAELTSSTECRVLCCIPCIWQLEYILVQYTNGITIPGLYQCLDAA